MTLSIDAWNREGTHHLLVDGRLPQVALPAGATAPPCEIVEAIRAQCGLDVALLRVARSDLIEVECLTAETPPPDMVWHPGAILPPLSRRSPWHRPGWIGGLLAEVDENLAQVGIARIHPPTQVRHTTVTGMLRLDTTSGSLWLKSGLSLFSHEGAVTRLLSDFRPEAIPEVVSYTPDWWVSRAFPLPAPTPPTVSPFDLLADLQSTSASHLERFRLLGVPERPISDLPDELATLASRDDLLPCIYRRRLKECLGRLARACRAVDALGFPPAVAHGDLTRANMLWTMSQWFIFDWTDACLTHPFVDLVFVREYVSQMIRTTGQRLEGEITARYASSWRPFASEAAISASLEAAAAIGAAHQVGTYQRLLDVVDRSGADESSGDQLSGLLTSWVERLVTAL
jgi:hypothetical protein